MRAALEAAAQGYNLYQNRRQEFNTGLKIPFRVSPSPLSLTDEQKCGIQRIGNDVADYFQAVDELYQNDIGGVRAILDTGKPQIFIGDQHPHYLFVRPDLIITPNGFCLCEIETSPFGLALAEILNRAYQNQGYETLVSNGTLPAEAKRSTPVEGTVLFSGKTRSYAGQLTFLAEQVFSGEGRSWHAKGVNEYPNSGDQGQIYRGFYLEEYLEDPSVRLLLEDHSRNENHDIIPSLTPYLEEKATLALIYDRRFESFLRVRLGEAAWQHLRTVIPPTWIVGQEEFFSLGMPGNISRSVDLASLSRSKRAYVLKDSGFSPVSSWAQGVHFLHQESREKTAELLHRAEGDSARLYVVQEFRRGAEIPMLYESEDNEERCLPISARVRLTPFFSIPQDGKSVRLVAIKATGRANTDFIHGSSDSINTAVN